MAGPRCALLDIDQIQYDELQRTFLPAAEKSNVSGTLRNSGRHGDEWIGGGCDLVAELLKEKRP